MARRFSPLVVSGALGLFLAAAPGAGAWAACTHDGATFILALAGDTCLAASATYDPGAGTGVHIPLLGFTDTGYGFVAAGGVALIRSDFSFPHILTEPANVQPPGVISTAGPVIIQTTSNTVAALYALDGGQIATGQIAINASGQNAIGVWAASQGVISLNGPATLTMSGPGGIGALVGATSAVKVAGPLTIDGLGANAVGVELTGAGPNFAATGGGTITTTGPALQMVDASNFIATFDNFRLTSSAAALIAADPSSGTVTFNSSTVNAGSGTLLNVAGGGAVSLIANASTLAGAVAIDPASQANVALNAGSTWSVSGNSILTSLTNNASAIAFSAPSAGAFKTLTTGAYYGAGGATLTLNTLLGGNSSPTDRLIINGGTATGKTQVAILNAGGTGGQTTGYGIPVIVAVNGATTSAGAFQMTNALVAGAYQYILVREPDQDLYLQSFPVALPQQGVGSLTGLANAHANQMITGQVLGSILLGANEQINCTNCDSAFVSIGSFALGGHGRWALTDSLTVLGGFSCRVGGGALSCPRASLRPPLKLNVRFSRIQLS